MSFITEIAPLIQKYAPLYGIKVVSPIIGQAVCESDMGKSQLATEAHNYFGLKANKNWNGDIIIVSTNEEYQAGILTRIDAKFRKFKNMEDGVKGYFEFINNSRYANLKTATDPRQYMNFIKLDRYATSSKYVDTVMNFISKYDLTMYDKIIESIISQGHGSLAPKYLFVHETANPSVSALQHIKYWKSNPTYAVHYICDWTSKVYHTVADNCKCYHVGNANSLGVGIELCHASNQSDFIKVWNTAVDFCADYLKRKNWSIDKLMSHNEARIKWGGTTHTDPDGYFKKYGKTWSQFKNDVQKKMNNNITVNNTFDYSSVFDFKYYSNRYPDLKNNGLFSQKQLLDHFINFGMKECRQGNAEFNVIFYKDNYKDLRNAFGTNWELYYKHYCTHGKGEKRIANKKI